MFSPVVFMGVAHALGAPLLSLPQGHERWSNPNQHSVPSPPRNPMLNSKLREKRRSMGSACTEHCEESEFLYSK